MFRDLDTFYSPLRGTETMDARLHLVPTFGVLENDSLLNKKDTDGTVLHYYYNGTGMEMAFTTLRNGMKRQAYRDELTQVKNVAAYDYKIAQLDQIILSKKPLDFGVVMVDLNQLKLVNDRFGHEKGNIAIKSLCQAVCCIYKHSPVYRVGGDEFVVILEGEDYQNREALFEQVRAFEKKRDMEGESPWTQLSASLGMAVYEPRRDKIYQDVFNCADAKMYECKQRLGACR